MSNLGNDTVTAHSQVGEPGENWEVTHPDKLNLIATQISKEEGKEEGEEEEEDKEEGEEEEGGGGGGRGVRRNKLSEQNLLSPHTYMFAVRIR